MTSATTVKMNSANRFEIGATVGVLDRYLPSVRRRQHCSSDASRPRSP
jgi:hypothetical protein